MKRQKRCAGCKELYSPDTRNYHGQRYCSQLACQAIRTHRKWQHWKAQQPLYETSPERRKKQKLTREKRRKNNPNYWKNYRRSHPRSTQRNREQQNLRDARRNWNLANPTGLNTIHLDKLAQIRVLGSLANPTGLNEVLRLQIEGILNYLRWSRNLANPTAIDPGRPPVRE